MLSDGRLPLIGSESNMLGVRVPPHHHPDIIPDNSGQVNRGIGGMSVSPEWRDLRYFLISSRLKHLVPEARGKASLHCFRFGDGPFVECTINEGLILKPDSDTHATVQPANPVFVVEFQRALADTQDKWQIDEA